MTDKLNISPVDLWVADARTRVIGRQNTQDDSFSVTVYPGSSYLLFAFDEDNGNEEWTAETLNQQLYTSFTARNDENVPYKINRYQLIGLANTSRTVDFLKATVEKRDYDEYAATDPDFFSTLAGSYRLSFSLKPNVTLPSLPQNVLDLFEANQVQSKVARHFQQPYKNYSVTLVDDMYSTKYMALVVVNAVDENGEDIVIDSEENYALGNYFVMGTNTDDNIATDPLFSDVQNLGHLIEDKSALKILEKYYDVTLLGANQMRIKNVG